MPNSVLRTGRDSARRSYGQQSRRCNERRAVHERPAPDGKVGCQWLVGEAAQAVQRSAGLRGTRRLRLLRRGSRSLLLQWAAVPMESRGHGDHALHDRGSGLWIPVLHGYREPSLSTWRALRGIISTEELADLATNMVRTRSVPLGGASISRTHSGGATSRQQTLASGRATRRARLVVTQKSEQANAQGHQLDLAIARQARAPGSALRSLAIAGEF